MKSITEVLSEFEKSNTNEDGDCVGINLNNKLGLFIQVEDAGSWEDMDLVYFIELNGIERGKNGAWNPIDNTVIDFKGDLKLAIINLLNENGLTIVK